MSGGNKVAQGRRRRERPVGRTHELWHTAKTRAGRKEIPFSLTKKRILSAIEGGVCEVTGIPFDLRAGLGRLPFSPSIDRIEIKGPYSDENVQIVVQIHNQARGEWGNGALKKYLKSFLTQKV